MRSSPALYPAVEILHIFGFVVLVGSILALDLRLLGVGSAIPIHPMAQLLLPLSRLGFLLAISMGLLLFSADAAHVVRNPAAGQAVADRGSAGQYRNRACRPVAGRCALALRSASGRQN